MNKNKLFWVLLTSFGILLSTSLETMASSDTKGARRSRKDAPDSADIVVHHVGQGNCVTVRVGDEMAFFDAGSSAFKKEFAHTAEQSPVQGTPIPVKEQRKKRELSKGSDPKHEAGGGSVSSSSSSSSSSLKSITPMVKKKVNIRENQEDADYDDDEESARDRGKKRKPQKEESPLPKSLPDLARKIRQNLGLKPNKPLMAKLVVVTHPDKDHCNLLPLLFKKEGKDKITYLILAGLPWKYVGDLSKELDEESDKKRAFGEWIGGQLEKGTKIYFPAMSFEAVKSWSQVEAWTKLDENAPNRGIEYAPQTNNPEQFEHGKEMFCLGKTKLIPLSVNPTHYRGENGILRAAFDEDANSDSLVFKVEHGGSSAILTGDATSLTTDRIVDNYAKNLGFLKTTLLLPSHHGSESHGSNNAHWIGLTQPHVGVFSNGHTYGHPGDSVFHGFYNALEESVRVAWHKVLVGDKENQKVSKIRTQYITNRPLFSTLTNGTVTVSLSSGKDDFKVNFEEAAASKKGKKKEEEKKEEPPKEVIVEETSPFTVKTSPLKEGSDDEGVATKLGPLLEEAAESSEEGWDKQPKKVLKSSSAKE